LERVPEGRVRLLGIAARALSTAPAEGEHDPMLFAELSTERRRRLEAVVADVRDRWDGAGLKPAALLERHTPRAPRRR
jgi:hypothetical protein